MDDLFVVAFVLAWLAILAVLLLRTPEHRGRDEFGTWLVLTLLTIGIEVLILFPANFVVLFIFREGAATVSVVLSALLVVATPFAWAIVLRRRARHAPRG